MDTWRRIVAGMFDPNNPVPRWSVSTMQRVAAEPTLAAAALRYANLGIPVFPCVPGAKQPLTPNGFHDAATDPKAVQQWWHRTPEANIGLPTGAATGVLVVDVDVHEAGSGYGAFEQARTRGLAESWAWLVRTPSGGLHAYYPPTSDKQPCWQSPRSHIDFRGDGGYVIAPPSRIEIGGAPTAYEVIAVANHAPTPLDAARLRRFLDPPRRMPQPHGPATEIGTSPARLAAWVARLPEGNRNGGLFWAACEAAKGRHPIEVAMATIGTGAKQAGLPESEIESTICSAYRIASRTPAVSRPGSARRSEVIGL
ncbi:bifunctional DNA primase/polymerase [Nocardioides sp.]|uniref:bifunctional DNA primase/polymerase n=1 Tax=Nocardioides sp. TaxID=35761 RepID=UPI002D16D86A|nr:bifunctional DNA primase/polymerase [Nocardioides sp.]HXH78397.1 bifunctional DNA primase/polymerase [Nocardioides sp.]